MFGGGEPETGGGWDVGVRVWEDGGKRGVRLGSYWRVGEVIMG